MNKKGFTLVELMIGVVFLLVIPVLLGFGLNIYKLTKCDFKEPYRAETLRLVGIFIPPVGVVEGFLTIEDK